MRWQWWPVVWRASAPSTRLSAWRAAKQVRVAPLALVHLLRLVEGPVAASAARELRL